MEKLIIDGINLDEAQSRITFVGLADIPGLAAQIFAELAEAGIVVDMIVQSIGRENRASISVTVAQADLEKRSALPTSRWSCSNARRRRTARRWPSSRFSASA